MVSRHLCVCALLALSIGTRLPAQQAGHDMAAMKSDSTSATTAHVMAQLIPLVTRASPSAGARTHTQAALTQALLMARVGFWRQRVSLDMALNGEGITMADGELNTGAYGEGFVDRRHPHTYVHELMLTGQGTTGTLAYSASVGRGFPAFGTDDPMMRPMVKYPINHHLSQILERATLTGALRLGPASVEASTFGGDEPTEPSSLPNLRRFGDSWAMRATIRPMERTELQASYARVASPEEREGHGLDQRKHSASARATSARGARYVLAEWSRTVERDHDRDLSVFGFESALLEAQMRGGRGTVALRLEQTDRPEEDRLADPFRTPSPHADLNINGITRWRVITAHVAAPAVTSGVLHGFPFLELARLFATSRDSRSFFTPERLYGSSRFWMVTAGVRLRAGPAHERMGRYGVSLPSAHSLH